MALANKRGQHSRWRNHRHAVNQRRMAAFDAYLEENPIFAAELITEPPAGALLLPMAYRHEGLYQHPMGQGIVYLDAWQRQPRTVQPSAHKPPPRKRRKADAYTSLVVEHWMKKKEKPMHDPTVLVDEHDRLAYQHEQDLMAMEIEQTRKERDYWFEFCVALIEHNGSVAEALDAVEEPQQKSA
jgi:hypothetical protein